MNNQFTASKAFNNNGSEDTKNINGENGLSCLVDELTLEIKGKLSAISTTYDFLDVLPENFQKLIIELSEKYKFPTIFSLAYLLYAFSIAIGNNFRIKVKKTWIEPVILYMAVVAKAGQTKTPVQNFFMAVFKELDKGYFEAWEAAVKKWEADKKAAATGGIAFNEEKPRRKQLFIQDYTPESLIKVLSDNWHGIGLMLDELSMLFGNMNKYNSGNEIPMWLTFFNAQAYSLNRKTSADLYVAHPFVSIIGGIQLGILAKAFAGDMKINGYADRYLYVFPVGLKKEVAGEEEIDDNLIDAYTEAITFLLSIDPQKSEDGKNAPAILEFEPDAKKLLFKYLHSNADKVNELNDTGQEQLAGMYSKFDYHVIRLSCILQIMADACEKTITTCVSLKAVQGGIRLADFFKVHSGRVHGLINNDPVASFDEIKKALYNSLPDSEFSFSDATTMATTIRSNDVQAGKIKSDAIDKWVQRFLQTSGLFSQPKTGYYIKKSLKKV